MDTNAKNLLINTFAKGMDTDTSDALISNESYRLANNLRYITDTDENTGELHMIEGCLELGHWPISLTLLETWNGGFYWIDEIIATTQIRNVGILIVRVHERYNTEPTGKEGWAVIRFNGEKPNEADQYKLVFGACWELIGDGFKNKLSLVTRWESEENVKLYIADGEHPIMTINIFGDRLYNELKNITNGNNIALSQPTLEEEISGNLKPALVSYSYRLYNQYGVQTLISPTSRIFKINNYRQNQNYDAIGVPYEEKSNKGFKLKFEVDDDFDRIQVFRITYEQNGQLPSIEMIYDSRYTTFVETIGEGASALDVKYTYIEDKGRPSLLNLTVEEYNSASGIKISANVIESKDDYLFAAGITYKEDTHLFEDWDARAFTSGDTYSGISIITIQDGNAVIAQTSIDADIYNENYDLSEHYDVNKWLNASGKLGADGEHISFELITTSFELDENIGCWNVYNSPDYSQNIDPVNKKLRKNKSLRRDELYRYGIVLYNDKGYKSTPKWIADVRTPSINCLSGKQDGAGENYWSDMKKLFRINQQQLFPDAIYCNLLGIKFTISNLPEGCIGYEIVRCNRGIDDRATVALGVISATFQNIHESNVTDYGKYNKDFIFPTGLVTVQKMTSGTIANNDRFYSSSNEYLLFFSPEISYLGDDIEDILKGNNTKLDLIQLVGPKTVMVPEEGWYSPETSLHYLIATGGVTDYENSPEHYVLDRGQIIHEKESEYYGALTQRASRKRTTYCKLYKCYNSYDYLRYNKNFYYGESDHVTLNSNNEFKEDVIFNEAVKLYPGIYKLSADISVVPATNDEHDIRICGKSVQYHNGDKISVRLTDLEMQSTTNQGHLITEITFTLYEDITSVTLSNIVLSLIDEYDPTYIERSASDADNTLETNALIDILDTKFSLNIPRYDSFATTGSNTALTYNTISVPIGSMLYCPWVFPLSYVDNESNLINAFPDKDNNVNLFTIGISGRCALLEIKNPDRENNQILYNIYYEKPETSSNQISNPFKTYICNIRKQVNPYGGNSYYDRSNSVYYGHGYYKKRDVENETYTTTDTISVFDGDCFVQCFEFMTMHQWDHPTFVNHSNNTTVYVVPLETDVDIVNDHGDRFSHSTGEYKMLIQDQPVAFGDLYILENKRPEFAYNTAYSAQPMVNINPGAGELHSVDEYDYRVHYSNLKTNNETVDNWTIFQPLNYIDVDTRYGRITNLRTFKNQLLFWQNEAFGKLSVLERILISDDSNLPLILGTGGLLDRYDYISTKNGMKENQFVDAQSNTTLYWFDYDRGEICGYAEGNVVSLSKTKFVLNFINKLKRLDNLLSDPLLTYDEKYNEVICTISDGDDRDAGSLVYNEMLQRFSGLYTITPKASMNFYNEGSDKKDLFFVSSENLIHKWNEMTITNNEKDPHGFEESLLKPYIKYIINNNPTFVKVYDNTEFAGMMYDGGNKPATDDTSASTISDDINFVFKTPLNQEGRISGSKITNRQYDFKFAIPRCGYDDSDSGDWVTKEWGDRLRGKTMQCEMSSNSNSPNFSLQYIMTKYRISWS